ncbi:MAG: toxin [Moraxellaceae bacterium]|jgi:toxin YhaV|nr:toxin [Moraxellaceae bacterium]
MSPALPAPLVINGWAILAHPLFLDQFEALLAQVEQLQARDPVGYVRKNATKRLAAITTLAFEVIPQDPARPEYRQGDTLGADYKHWFRARFFQQYRLFFRYHLASRIIVLAWVNDEDTRPAPKRDTSFCPPMDARSPVPFAPYHGGEPLRASTEREVTHEAESED